MNDLDDDWYAGLNLRRNLVDGGARYARRNSFLAQARMLPSTAAANLTGNGKSVSVQTDTSALAARIALQNPSSRIAN